MEKEEKRATNLKISRELPPNYRTITDSLGDVGKALFCYGDTIYNPFNRTITPDLEIHEEVHSKQMGDNPDVWWYNYLTDSDFRLTQELQAYATQYAFVKNIIRGQLLSWSLKKMAEALSSKAYGNLLSLGEAETKIKNYAKFNL